MQQTIVFIIAGIFGAIATFLLQKHTACTAVVASSLIGLLGALIGHFVKTPELKDVPIVIFAGSFAGMTSITFGTIPLILLAGAVTGLLYKLTLKTFVGFGGRLGTMAFISTVVCFYLLGIIKKFRK